MSNPTDSAPSASPQPSATSSARKVDLVTAPGVALLASCVIAALGNSRGSELLTWQVPIGIVVLAAAYTAFRVMRARA